MELQWSLVVFLLLAVQTRANPWIFGEDHPNFRVIYQINGQILPFTYNTRRILTIPPCMSLKYVWVHVANTFGFMPTVKFHKSINVISIVYGFLQHTGSDYSIVVKGFRTPNCKPGVQQNENGYFPHQLKGRNSLIPRTKNQKLKFDKKNKLQRNGQDYKETFDSVDIKNSIADDDSKDKKNEYVNDSEDKYDSVKESYENMSSELKGLGNYLVFIIPRKKAGQPSTKENGDSVGYDRGSIEADDGKDRGLDYGNGKNYSHKSSKYIVVGEYSGGKGHSKSGSYDRERGNAKSITYMGSGNRHNKKETYSEGIGFKSDNRNSMINGYSGSNGKRYGKGKGYMGSGNHENDQVDSYDDDSESYRHKKNKNSVGNGKESGQRGSSDEENYKVGSYAGDIRYVGSSGQANNKGYGGSNGLDDEYLDVFDFDKKNQPDVKDIKTFCSDYLRAYNGREGNNLAVDKKVMDFCLFEFGRSKF